MNNEQEKKVYFALLEDSIYNDLEERDEPIEITLTVDNKTKEVSIKSDMKEFLKTAYVIQSIYEEEIKDILEKSSEDFIKHLKNNLDFIIKGE